MPRTILAILAIGAAARLWGYATAGPLWLDELFIDHNLDVLTFAGLLGPLLDGQNAPVGWLWLTKALRSGWGDYEAILRLPALLASLGSLPLAYAVARRAVGERAAAIPALLVAWSPFAVWQSFQLKPYAVDLALALLLLWLAQRAVDPGRRPGRRPWLALAGAGAAATWLSLPAIFVLAGVGAVLALDALRRPGPGRIATCVTLGAAWLS
ncbi:MAG: glycosyltransferase family 39 protein, partial [Acidobacteriota bacterium]